MGEQSFLLSAKNSMQRNMQYDSQDNDIYYVPGDIDFREPTPIKIPIDLFVIWEERSCVIITVNINYTGRAHLLHLKQKHHASFP